MEERQHGDTLEHRHDGCDYWHPATRVHAGQPAGELPIGHILADVVPYTKEKETPRGLQVKPFDWVAWDEGCEAKGICQGFASVEIPEEGDKEAHTLIGILTESPEWKGDTWVIIPPTPITKKELHHRQVAPDLIGLAEAYWQCPHCKQLQKPIQWVQGARLETYWVKVRGSRTIIWVKVSSGAWFVLVIRAYGSLQGVARGICEGTVYFCGIPSTSEAPPLQLPDECATILARRMWHRLTKGYWSDRKKEVDC